MHAKLTRRTAVLLAALAAALLLSACSVSTEPPPVDVEVDLNEEEHLKDLIFYVSDMWADMGKQTDIDNSHLYTIGKSQQNYIGLSVLYFDDAAVEVGSDVADGEIKSTRDLDLGDGGIEYRVDTVSGGSPYELYHARIPYGGGVYVLTLMGYDLSPADEMWEDFLSRLEFG